MFQFSSIPSFVADGDIFPSRFVAIDNDFTVKQSTATDVPIGVCGQYTRKFDDQRHAADGETVLVFTVGSYCYLEVGASVTPGAYLKPDANGRGVPASNSGDIVGAIALETAQANSLCRVMVWLGKAP
jgi:hypothetical protein